MGSSAAQACYYEPLAGGVEEPPPSQQPQPPHLQQQQQQPAGPAPALGVPVLGVPLHPPPPARYGAAAAPTAGQLDDWIRMPTAAEEWDRASVLVSVWLGAAVATLAISVLTANTFAITGSLCAVIGGCTHRFARCRGGANLAQLVARTHTLSLVAASLCGVVAVLSTLLAFGLSAGCNPESGLAEQGDEKACAALTELTLLYALWFVAFTMLCTAVSRRTRRMTLLLNPVSSGMVSV